MSERESSLHTEILLVEETPSDVLLTRRALKPRKVLHNLTSQLPGREYSFSCAARANMLGLLQHWQ
jgi:hypothetical protein